MTALYSKVSEIDERSYLDSSLTIIKRDYCSAELLGRNFFLIQLGTPGQDFLEYLLCAKYLVVPFRDRTGTSPSAWDVFD